LAGARPRRQGKWSPGKSGSYRHASRPSQGCECNRACVCQTLIEKKTATSPLGVCGRLCFNRSCLLVDGRLGGYPQEPIFPHSEQKSHPSFLMTANAEHSMHCLPAMVAVCGAVLASAVLSGREKAPISEVG